MQKIGKGNYEQESFLQQFYRSCLGKAIILCAVIALLLTAAYFSVPDEKTMYAETVDNVRQSISANIESKEDEIDCVVNNFSAFFTYVDSTEAKEVMADFFKYNKIEVHKHTFYATTRIYNNIYPDGRRSGIGIFGIVIPTIKYKNLLLYVGTLRKKYNQPIIKRVWASDPDLGSNPNLGNTHNTYEGGGSKRFD